MKKIREFSGTVKTGLTLKTARYKITLKPHKSGHMHVTIKCSDGPYHPNFKKQGLTSLGSELTGLEGVVALYYFFRLARDYNRGFSNTLSEDLRNTNYAEIFGAGYL